MKQINEELINERNNALELIIERVNKKSSNETLTHDYLKKIIEEAKELIISDF